MKKSIFFLAFLSIIIFATCVDGKPQSLSSFLRFDYSHESSGGNQKDELGIHVIDEDKKEDELIKTEDSEIGKSDKSSTLPSSSKISIKLGKVLFEKYIK